MVKQGLHEYAPEPPPETQPEAGQASVKAIDLAEKVLLDQAGIVAQAAETELQSVVELRQPLLPA